MHRLKAILLAVAAILLSSGCLVVSVNPGYDENAIGWDPNLIGSWVDADDKATLEIDRGEWKSYRIHYVHPIETGDLTGYLTAIGDERYLDVMPVRGEDRGSFLLPLHAMLHLRLEGDQLELTPLSYEWFNDHLRAGRPVPGLSATLDQKENALLVSPADRFRDWLRVQSVDGPAFGASATFARKSPRSVDAPQQEKKQEEAQRATADGSGDRDGGRDGDDVAGAGPEPQRGRVHTVRAARARDRVVQDHLRRDGRLAWRKVLLQSDPDRQHGDG